MRPAHGDEIERRIELIAQNLGIGGPAMHRSVASLLGGERGRLHLGVVLAERPAVLILDGPTNLLDLATITRLEAHLADYPGAVLVVAHDRAFLDHTCRCTYGIEFFTLSKVPRPAAPWACTRSKVNTRVACE